MTSAGELTQRLRFMARRADANGDRTGPLEVVFETRAKRTFLRGGEPVLAARLDGVQPVAFRIRRSKDASAVSTDFEIVDARDQTTFTVTSVEFSEDRLWIDILGALKRGEQANGQ
jgi:hypothetical protein